MSGKKQTNHGFTLIELLIVVSLSVMMMLAASALFMTFLIGGAKTNTAQTLKSEGTFALNQIEFLIRNAEELQLNSNNERCQASMDEFVIKSLDGGVTALFAETDPADSKSKIASNSGTYLTSGNNVLIDGPTFDCSETVDNSVPYVTVSFTLRHGTDGVDKDRDIVEQTFTTGISLRNL